MEGMKKVVYCKYCANMCIKLVSHSIENRIEEFYCFVVPTHRMMRPWMGKRWADGKHDLFA
ncbi:hypothetical protein Leryth_024493 [Lithospermum erythrorhizon]|nr:hypothetical protein Leryth_024493 [Lithospermum erythrorhizon]